MILQNVFLGKKPLLNEKSSYKIKPRARGNLGSSIFYHSSNAALPNETCRVHSYWFSNVALKYSTLGKPLERALKLPSNASTPKQKMHMWLKSRIPSMQT